MSGLGAVAWAGCFIVMESLEGEDLARVLVRSSDNRRTATRSASVTSEGYCRTLSS